MSVVVNTEVAGGAGIGEAAGAGIATSSGSDMTDATVDAGLITAYSAGADWVITRSGTTPLTQHLLGDVALKSDLTHEGSGIYTVSGGLKFVSGALSMTLAQRNTWVALTPTIAQGFLIFVNDVGLITNASGTTYVPGAFQRWVPGFGFVWVTPVRYENYQTSSSINNASGAWATLRSQVVPATVAGPYSRVRMMMTLDFTGAAATKSARMQINSASIYEVSGSAAGTDGWNITKSLYGMGASTQRRNTLNAGDFNSVSSAFATTSIDFSTADLTCTVQGTVTSTDTCVDLHFAVHVLDESNVF